MCTADESRLRELVSKDSSYDHCSKCLEGTRKHIRDHIDGWIEGGIGQLLWLHGPAGSGKSTIAATVAKELHDRGLLAGSFFCKQDNERLRKPENVISTVAALLANKYQAYGQELLVTLRNDLQLDDLAVISRFEKLIVSPMRDLGPHIPPRWHVIVIGALDECGTPETRIDIATCLLRLSSLTDWLKIIVTSRPDRQIQQVFGVGSSSTTGVHPLNLRDANVAEVRSDIYAFISNRLFAIPRENIDTLSWPSHESIKQLVSLADGSFIWAQTACKLISDSIDPELELDQLLIRGCLVVQGGPLCALYTTVLEKAQLANNVNPLGGETSPVQNFLATIVVTSSRRPLPIDALGALMGVRPQPLLNMVRSLGSVLYIDNNQAVRTLHQSFNDFLLDQANCPEQYRVNADKHNASLTLA